MLSSSIDKQVKELLRQYPHQDLQDCLDTGFERFLLPEVPLKAAQAAAEKIGIQRISEIGRFVDSGVQVFQTARPNLFHHPRTGMNTGSQGKGYTHEQGQISAIMEALEGYSVEPRNAHLIRACYSDLREQYVVLDPERLSKPPNAQEIDNQPLMWTSAQLVNANTELLLPAELVYTTFHQSSYGCPSAFACTSNGLGAGFSYEQAIRQALFELIERYYVAYLERFDAKIEAIRNKDPRIAILLRAHSEEFLEEYDVQFFSVQLLHLSDNIPFVFCIFVGDTDTFYGYGISFDPVCALQKAHLEAFQCMTTIISGAREDLAKGSPMTTLSDDEYDARCQERWPNRRTLDFSDWAARFPAEKGDEPESRRLLSWLEESGHPVVCIANLTRVGVDIPVVRAFVPGLDASAKYMGSALSGWLFDSIAKEKYRYD